MTNDKLQKDSQAKSQDDLLNTASIGSIKIIVASNKFFPTKQK